MKKINTTLLIWLITSIGFAQTSVEQNVISSGGNESSTTTIQVTSTIGEAIIKTVGTSPVVLTQGFQQTFNGDTIGFDVTVTSPLCNERNDGFAEISNIVGCEGPYSFLWSSGSVTNRANNLGIGPHSVTVTSSDRCTQVYNFVVTAANNLPCLLKFYSGITPNADGANDTWVIDNIQLFPINEIKFYNRLGNKVWEGKNYDNLSVVWGGENLSGNDLPSDTYFYIFESGSNVEKGWVELTR